jgi:DNA polymerase-3 subunit delta
MAVARVTSSQFERGKYKVEGQWCVLYGPDDYRKREALEGLLRRLASDEGGLFEPVTLDGAGCLAAQVLESAQTPNLFGPSVTVVRGIQNMHTDEQKALAEGLDRIAPNALVVLVSASEEGRGPGAALLRAVEKEGTAVAFEQPKDPEARRWVQEQAQRLNMSIEPGATALLVETVGTNLVELHQELDKLALFAFDDKRITTRHVEAVTPRSLDDNVFHMVDALSAGQVDRALTLLQDLLAKGNDRGASAGIIGALAYQFRMIWHAKRLMEAGWRPDKGALTEEQAALVPEEAAKVFKVGWRAGKAAKLAPRFPWARLVSILEQLAECDLALKGGSDARLGLEKLVISLSTPPRPR